MLGLVLGAVAGCVGVVAIAHRRSSRGLRGIVPTAYSYYNEAPEGLRNLPVNLLRTNLPLESEARMQALQEYVDGVPSRASLPQNMIMTRWHTGAGDFGASVTGVVEAVQLQDGLIEDLVNAQYTRVPHMTLSSVGRQLNRLPQSRSSVENPIARGLPQQPVIPAPQFWAHMQSGAPMTPMSPFDQGAEYDTVWAGRRMLQIERK